MFISLDGVDGAGKSTQITLLREWLRAAGHEVVVCRDPGSTELGEAIRELLLDHRQAGMCRRAEMLLYMAARAQLVDEIIRPALSAGKVVISDRYLLANVVYQGYAGGLDVPSLWNVGCLATEALMPTLTLVLDLTPEAAASRMNRVLDRMESQGEEFRRRLRDGFLREAARNPQHIVVIDAGRSVEAVQADVRAAIAKVIQPHTGIPSPRPS